MPQGAGGTPGTDDARLRRLLAPRHVAVVGGEVAAEVVRQCHRIGYAGEIWPVHPRRETVGGLPCYRDIASLPAGPDAAFVAVPGDATVSVVAQLAARGAGGAVCHASGFAEAGADGAVRQRDLVAAAGAMPVIGPNCFGVLNYLDGAALWPDQHGGRRVDRGVAILTQSGNLAQNITMQRRSLPIAQLVTVGNSAVVGVTDVLDAMLDDPRISAVGIHVEGVADVAAFSRAALRALRLGVPVVVLKAGASEIGARVSLSHTSSLAGSDRLFSALFDRYGIARVHDVPAFVETLKFLHVHGALAGTRIASASCSGGEAALVADLAQRRGLRLPPLPDGVAARLRAVLGDRVDIANPLDYHTYIWGDLPRQRRCFQAFLGAGFDAHLLVIDVPRDDRCVPGAWHATLDGFVAAHGAEDVPACVVSSMPEGLPEPVGERLLRAGIAPMQGLMDCLDAVAASARIGHARARVDDLAPVRPVLPADGASACRLDEWTAKRALAAYGVTVPEGVVVSRGRAPDTARRLGFPVAVKVASAAVAHKSDVGGVRLGLTSGRQVRDAVAGMRSLGDRFLVERMAGPAVAELIVGVRRDPQFGPVLTIGAGGVLVELVDDVVTLLLPVSEAEIRAALRSLRSWPLLDGFRGRPGGDVDAVVDAVARVAAYATAEATGLVELDVNPLLVLPRGQGAVAVDVLTVVDAYVGEGAA